MENFRSIMGKMMTHIVNDFYNFDSMTDKDDAFQLQEQYTVKNCERKKE